MGQKIQPYGLRLGINKTWKSKWFAKGADFQNQLHEDIRVRKYIKEKLDSAGVDSVIITRSTNRISIKIEVARPGVVIGRGGTGIEDLKKKIGKKDIILEIIANGIFQSLKYYLRFIVDYKSFIKVYTQNLIYDAKSSTEVKDFHIIEWKKILTEHCL